MFARTRTSARRVWPVAAIAAPAFVATWSGWVGLGEKAGFGPVRLLPGIADQVVLNTAITLPIGIEAYAAYAIGVWLSSKPMSARTRRFAMLSGVSSLILGAFGQVAYHLLEVFGAHVAPWQVVVGVSCLPIAVVGMTAALLHLLRADDEQDATAGNIEAGNIDPSRYDGDVFADDLPNAPIVVPPVEVRDEADVTRDDPRPVDPSRDDTPHSKPTVEQDEKEPSRDGGVATIGTPIPTETVLAYLRDYHRREGRMPSIYRAKTDLGKIGADRVKGLIEQVEQDVLREAAV
jgi:hypothetical protein